jgi:hypothetical protein
MMIGLYNKKARRRNKFPRDTEDRHDGYPRTCGWRTEED